MVLPLAPRDQLHAELRHRYLKLCNRYGPAAVQPANPELVKAYLQVVDAAGVRGTGAVLAAVQSAGESYEFVVGRWCDSSWRAMVEIALQKGLGVPEQRPTETTLPQTEAEHHLSAGFYWKGLAIEA